MSLFYLNSKPLSLNHMGSFLETQDVPLSRVSPWSRTVVKNFLNVVKRAKIRQINRSQLHLNYFFFPSGSKIAPTIWS